MLKIALDLDGVIFDSENLLNTYVVNNSIDK